MSPNANDHADKAVSINEEKDGAIFCEDTASVHSVSKVPDTLKDLSEDERRVLEKKLVRRIDLRLLPMLVLMYIMNYLDRNNIASAKLAGKVGMLKDLGMTSTEYNVCGLRIHVSYNG